MLTHAQPVQGSPGGCLRTVVYADFIENMDNVALDRMLRDLQFPGNLLVGGAARNPLQHLNFTPGQRSWQIGVGGIEVGDADFLQIRQLRETQ